MKIRDALQENDIELGVSVAVVGFPPMPASRTVCGLLGALSVRETVPVKKPAVPGLKMASIVQFAAETRFGMQLSFSIKFELATMPATVNVDAP